MKEDGLYPKAEIAFTEFLKAKKRRRTPERYAILKKIYAQDKHFNAEWLHKEMQNEYRVSLATVYNTIALLLECNLIIKHRFGKQEGQYEKRGNNKTSQQTICTECGERKDFINKPIRATINKKRFSHFEPSHYSLYLYGICSRCKKKKNFNHSKAQNK